MKLALIVSILIGSLYAEDAKVAQAPSTKPLSKEAYQHFRAMLGELAAAQAEAKLLEAKAANLQREYAEAVAVECAAVGVQAADAQQNCRVEPQPTQESATGRIQWIEKSKDPPKEGGSK